MKITIIQDASVSETEVTVVCRELNAQTNEIISAISLAGSTLVGVKDGETFFIPAQEVLYVESVDGKIFFYTADETYGNLGKALTESCHQRVSGATAQTFFDVHIHTDTHHDLATQQDHDTQIEVLQLGNYIHPIPKVHSLTDHNGVQ